MNILQLTTRVQNYIDKNLVIPNTSNTMYEIIPDLPENEESFHYRKQCKRSILYDSIKFDKKIDNYVNEHWTQIGAKLINFMEVRGFNYVKIYNAAEISSALWYKYVNGKSKPSRDSMYRMGLVMNLDFENAKQFLMIGGYQFTNTSKRDLAMQYFFENQITDYEEVNDCLNHLELEPLFTEE